jgi:hypothetical protein
MSENPQQVSAGQAVVAVVLMAGTIWFFYGGGLQNQAAANLAQIEKQVAADSERQYQIAKSGGGAMDACVQAGMVAAAYLQAKDSWNYEKWKKTEKADCERAGLKLP